MLSSSAADNEYFQFRSSFAGSTIQIASSFDPIPSGLTPRKDSGGLGQLLDHSEL